MELIMIDIESLNIQIVNLLRNSNISHIQLVMDKEQKSIEI